MKWREGDLGVWLTRVLLIEDTRRRGGGRLRLNVVDDDWKRNSGFGYPVKFQWLKPVEREARLKRAEIPKAVNFGWDRFTTAKSRGLLASKAVETASKNMEVDFRNGMLECLARFSFLAALQAARRFGLPGVALIPLRGFV